MCSQVILWCHEGNDFLFGLYGTDTAWAALNDAGTCDKGFSLESLCLPLNDIPV